jgi:hypothetical protein
MWGKYLETFEESDHFSSREKQHNEQEQLFSDVMMQSKQENW